MDNKEPKTEEAPVSPEGPGLLEAQPSTGLQSTSQVTSNDENKTKPNCGELVRIAHTVSSSLDFYSSPLLFSLGFTTVTTPRLD